MRKGERKEQVSLVVSRNNSIEKKFVEFRFAYVIITLQLLQEVNICVQ